MEPIVQPVTAEGEHPSIGRVIAATWRSFAADTRRKIIVSGALAAGLSSLDAAGVGLLPTLVNRLQGKGAGFLAGLSTPAVGAVVVALLITKSIGGSILLYWQAGFLSRGETDRAVALFGHFIRRPYGETSDTSSSEYVRDLHVSLPLLYRGAGIGLAQVIGDGLGLVGLVAVVLVSTPLNGLVLTLILVASALVYSSLVRTRVSRLSTRIHRENREFLNELSESFGGLKTVKAFAAEDTAHRRFARVRSQFSHTVQGMTFYPQISRYYLDIALVVGLGACMGVTYVVDGRAAVLTSFGLLAGVAARAMPAFGRILSALTGIKVAGTTVLALEPSLRRLDEEEAAGVGQRDEGAQSRRVENRAERMLEPSPPSLVALDRITFRYPTGAGDALREISLEVYAGELVAIVGESGSGKTTLVDLLIGLLTPQSGMVRRSNVTSVGYVSQDTFVWDDTVRFNVAFDRPPTQADDVDAEVWDSLEAASLARWVRGLPHGLDTRLGERGSRMSGGQRQRLGLARALYGHPSILVLDEPTSALDGETSRALMATLAAIRGGVGIVVVTHDPIVVEYADRTITLEGAEGRVVG